MKLILQCFYSYYLIYLLLISNLQISPARDFKSLRGKQNNIVEILTWPQSSIPIDFSPWKKPKSYFTSSSLSIGQDKGRLLTLGNTAEEDASEQNTNKNTENQLIHRFTKIWNDSELHEMTYRDRYATSHTVDYGGSHPYEIMERRRKLSSHNISSVNNDDTHRELKLAPWRQGAEYKHIRITLDTKYLPHKSETYRDKVELLITEILPPVKEFWNKALRVFPMNGNLKVNAEYCPYSEISQTTVGVPNTDLLVLVAANVKAICDNGPIAAARSCQADQYDRPVVGSAVVCLDKMNLEDETTKETYITVLIHEIGHVLGMRAVDFAYYYDSNTGLPRTPRPFHTQQVTCVDGAVADMIVPALNTMRQGRTKRGSLYYELVTPAVRTVARNQFNCHTMVGARLENQPTNHGNCFGTHWEARLYVSELLSAITTQTKQVVSPLTLAALEDSGWYKPDYSVAKISPFGHGRGCEFVYEDCIDENGNVPKWGEGFFCNGKLGPDSRLQCDGTRKFISRCDLVDFADYPNSVPPNERYQYFKGKPTWGGLLHTAAYCPMPSMVVTGTNADGIFEFDCTDTDLKSSVDPEYFGDDSRCYETNLARPICMHTYCDEVAHKVNVLINNRDVVVCENEGDWMKIPGLAESSKFQCPPLAVVCPDLICPQNCGGRGICDFRRKNPVCICCDPNDTSPACENSPIGCEYDFNDGTGVATNTPISVSTNYPAPVTAPTTYNGGGEFPSSTLPDTGYGASPSTNDGNGNGASTPNPSPISFGTGGYPAPSQNTGGQYQRPTEPQYPNLSPVKSYPSGVGSGSGSNSNMDSRPTITDIDQNDDFFNAENSLENDAGAPSSMPSPLPRDIVSVSFTFCLEHGILVPIFEVLSETSKSITNTLTELFNDDVQVMSDQWTIDEQHLRVSNVDSVWLEFPPEKLECTCETGDDTSSCSAVESSIQVSHWSQLDPDEVKYLLVYFGQYLAGGMPYKARYWGVEAVSTIVSLSFYGLPSAEMSEETKVAFEDTLKDFLNEKAATADVDQLSFLSVSVQNVSPISPNRSLQHKKRMLSEPAGVDVTTLVTAQYFPPPKIDFKELLEKMMDEGESDIINRLKESDDPDLKIFKEITNGISLTPTMAPTTLDDVKKEEEDQIEDNGGSNVGMILGIIVGLLALIAVGIAGYVYHKRQNDIDSKFDPDDFEPQKSLYEINPLDEDTTVSTMYGEKYDASKEYDTQSYYTGPSNYDKSVRSKIEYEDLQSNYSKDETCTMDPPSHNTSEYKHSFQGRSTTDYSIGEDSYISGPSQSYSYISRSQESHSDDDSSFVTGLSKNSFLPGKSQGDYQSSVGTRSRDPPSFSTDAHDAPSLDPPEENHNDDEDDLGTFAGRSINHGSFSDDISALPSLRGVEDTWFDDETMTGFNAMENIAEEDDLVEEPLNDNESAKDLSEKKSLTSKQSVAMTGHFDGKQTLDSLEKDSKPYNTDESEKISMVTEGKNLIASTVGKGNAQMNSLVEASPESNEAVDSSKIEKYPAIQSNQELQAVHPENSISNVNSLSLAGKGNNPPTESDPNLLEGNYDNALRKFPNEPPGRRYSMLDASQKFDPYSSIISEQLIDAHDSISPSNENSQIINNQMVLKAQESQIITNAGLGANHGSQLGDNQMVLHSDMGTSHDSQSNNNQMVPHSGVGTSHDSQSNSNQMVPHTGVSTSHDNHQMVPHTGVGTSHGIQSNSNQMVPHTGVGTSHGNQSNSNQMVPHTGVGTSHDNQSNSNQMVLRPQESHMVPHTGVGIGHGQHNPNQIVTIQRQNLFSSPNDRMPNVMRRSSLPSSTIAASFDPHSSSNLNVVLPRRNSLPSLSFYRNFDPYSSFRSESQNNLPQFNTIIPRSTSVNDQLNQVSNTNNLLCADQTKNSGGLPGDGQLVLKTQQGQKVVHTGVDSKQSLQVASQQNAIDRQTSLRNNSFSPNNASGLGVSTTSLDLDLAILQNNSFSANDSSSDFTASTGIDGCSKSVMSIE